MPSILYIFCLAHFIQVPIYGHTVHNKFSMSLLSIYDSQTGNFDSLYTGPKILSYLNLNFSVAVKTGPKNIFGAYLDARGSINTKWVTLRFVLNGSDFLYNLLVQLILKKVLMLGSKNETMIGRPVLVDAAVHAVVEEHVRFYFLLFLLKSEKD